MSVFEIYKKEQGKYVRWGTAAAIALLVGIGMYWLGNFVLVPITDAALVGPTTSPATNPATAAATEAVVKATPFIKALYIKTFIVTLFGAVGALLALWLVNRPKSADFMIMTESEMRKVNWPTRREVWVNTKVVIVLTLFFGILLGLADGGFVYFFQFIGILPAAK